MRGLIIKTSKFYSKDREKSTWPSGILKESTFEKGAREFVNVVTVLVCIEKGDKEDYIDELVARVKSLNDQFYKLSHIVVVPFGHLSHNLEGPIRAKSLIDELAQQLKKAKFNVDLISFGTHKDLSFDIPGQPAEVSYFEFPYSGKKPEIN